MPFYEGLCTIKRGGSYHPPGTIHELDENEAAALGRSRVREVVGVKVDVTAPALVIDSGGAAPLADEPSGDDASAEEPGGSSESDQADEGSSRIGEIKEAIDLLNEDDFVKTGHRKGLPKKNALEDILGYDATDEEIELALKLREEM